MTRTYEGMFLIDNEAVRAGWSDVKSSLAGLIEKHGGRVHTSRRWDERRLAYPVRRRNRATYLLAYFELAPEGNTTLRRELDISETFLRYLILSAESVPEKEVEISTAEQAGDVEIPEPPEDDAEEVVVERVEEDVKRGEERAPALDEAAATEQAPKDDATGEPVAAGKNESEEG